MIRPINVQLDGEYIAQTFYCEGGFALAVVLDGPHLIAEPGPEWERRLEYLVRRAPTLDEAAALVYSLIGRAP